MTMMTIVASVLVAAVEMMMTMTTGTNGMIATMTITMMMTTGAVVPDQEDGIAMTTMMTTKPPAFLIW